MKTFRFIFLILPPSLVLSTALSGLLITVVAIHQIYLIIYKKQFEIFRDKIFIVIFSFCVYIFLRSVFSTDPLISLESSLFYWRFIFFRI